MGLQSVFPSLTLPTFSVFLSMLPPLISTHKAKLPGRGQATQAGKKGDKGSWATPGAATQQELVHLSKQDCELSPAFEASREGVCRR